VDKNEHLKPWIERITAGSDQNQGAAEGTIIKKPGILIPGKHSLCKCLPFALAAMALVVTGCPHN
jgi:hypothetical protein